jgi:hypothetical protein
LGRSPNVAAPLRDASSLEPMNSSVLVTVAASLMAACGGSVTRAGDAGGGGAGTGPDDASVSETSVSDTGVTETGANETGVNDTGSPVEVVDSAPSCGDAGQSCCGTSCNAGNTCVVIDMMSECEACGQPGQPCCTTVPACANAEDGCFGGPVPHCANNGAGTLGQPGDRCTTSCADPTDTCVNNGMTSYCLECGGLGNPCCATTCRTGLQRAAGTCQ